jgi:hypothetical protein
MVVGCSSSAIAATSRVGISCGATGGKGVTLYGAAERRRLSCVQEDRRMAGNEHQRTPPWKDFEGVVAELTSQLDPSVSVEPNQRLIGRNSGIPRQIDVVLRGSIGPSQILVAVECKFQRRRVDVKQVGEFVTTLDDIGASRGVMVTNRGYSAGAVATAGRYGVDLLLLSEVAEHIWPQYFEKPVVNVLAILPRFLGVRVILQHDGSPGSDEICWSDAQGTTRLRDIEFVAETDRSRRTLMNLGDVFGRMWSEGAINRELGDFTLDIEPTDTDQPDALITMEMPGQEPLLGAAFEVGLELVVAVGSKPLPFASVDAMSLHPGTEPIIARGTTQSATPREVLASNTLVVTAENVDSQTDSLRSRVADLLKGRELAAIADPDQLLMRVIAHKKGP